MNKQQILQLTGLSEDQFYDQYPDQETFCNDYPEACAQLEQAQGGMQVGVTYDSSGNPVDISPDVTPSQWQTVDGMYTRPHTVDRFGNPIAPMTSVTRQPVDRVPFNRAQPMDVITPMIARYTLPKGMVDNTIPIEKFSAKQTMQQVGSIGKSYSAPVNKYQSIVDLLKSKGMDASFSSRKELAKQLGIDNYTGTATQNMTLLNLVADNSDQMKYGGITKYQPGGPYKSGPYVGSDPKIKLSKHPFADRYINPPAEPEERTFFGTASQFIPGYETYLDVKDIATGTFKGNKAQRNQGIIGLGQPFAGKAISGTLGYLSEKLINKDFADKNEQKMDDVVNGVQGMNGEAFTKKLFIKYGYGGYDKWVKDGKPKLEQGGTNIFPAMRNFKKGGYYGMDQKFHPNSDSGTYVGGAGYYFQPGGTAVTSSTPPGQGAGVEIGATPGATGSLTNGGYNPDGSFAGDFGNETNFNNSDDPYGVKDQAYGQNNYQGENPFNNSYNKYLYNSEIDPATGFTRYTRKDGVVLNNIKKQDPALWQHLKEEGHGARWQTGQTDFQKFGRTVGRIGEKTDEIVDYASIAGGFLNNMKQQNNIDNSATNRNSTAELFKNAKGSSRGENPVTGTGYGMIDPTKSGNFSFEGMYGKYGVEVPRYDLGGYIPDIASLNSHDLSSVGEIEPVSIPISIPVVDNTRVAPPRIPLQFRQQRNNPTPSNGIDVDLALQAVSGHESGVKPGQTKLGFKTRLIGEGGKRASASGTYQITTPTLQQIYKNDNNIRSNFKSFDQFKNAFDTNPDVEYAAARSLMQDHINNYGVYALGAWYQPTFAKRAMQGDKSVYDIIPRKDYGNKLKWGTDFKNKLNSYNKLAGTNYDVMKYGGQQNGGQVVEMDENEIQQFLAAGGQLEFLD